MHFAAPPCQELKAVTYNLRHRVVFLLCVCKPVIYLTNTVAHNIGATVAMLASLIHVAAMLVKQCRHSPLQQYLVALRPFAAQQEAFQTLSALAAAPPPWSQSCSLPTLVAFAALERQLKIHWLGICMMATSMQGVLRAACKPV